ncbi:ArdC family protein [Gimesia sp.]|uniref:ArdC family protein n=1 Tax=Gimesia sp. TaxID=2024833 RepID=UPI003A8F4130
MASQQEIRQSITNQIVEALEQDGVPPWQKPWGTGPNRGFPSNALTGNKYTGTNTILLRMASLRHSFISQHWATYNQWKSLGGTVMRRPNHIPSGQWGCRVTLFKLVEKEETDEITGEVTEETFPVLRAYTVFNVDQVFGKHLDYLRADAGEPDDSGFNDYAPAEDVIQSTNARIKYLDLDRAYYNFLDDEIVCPPKYQFQSEKAYYSTMLHELSHWTGHESRLNRLKKILRFGNKNYAEEELVAELSTCFLLAHLGVPQSEDRTNHVAYLKSWIKRLKNDNRFIFRAASAANKAADFILNCQQAELTGSC